MAVNDDARVMAAGMAPTPFTADEIRHGCPPGRITHLRTTTLGEPTITHITKFLTNDADGGTTEGWAVDESGGEIEPVTVSTFLWTDLQAHASFPVSSTEISSATIQIELGTFDCHRYVVTRDETVSTFWFAVDLPGMPIRFSTEIGGRTVSTATLIANEMP
ncbi:MAG: hypothetical protein KDB69_03795 [Acidimicrobiia bacterium]|nr:hypothetical protein [Acidimicrobiia bacterium]